MERFVIVGAGAAGIKAAERIRKMEDDAEITMISIDDQVHSRCMLHKVLGKERTEKGINFVPENFFEVNKIRFIDTEAVTQVDTKKQEITLSCGAFVPYDKLLLATGSSYVVPPIPHFREADNVFGFRDLGDARAIKDALDTYGKNVFIVGSGLVGLDAASALTHLGAKVTIAEMADRVMPLQTDAYAASVYQAAFEKAGCSFKLGVSANDSVVDDNGNIIAVQLSNGESIPCDFIIVAAGVRPKVDFLKDSGIEIERGIGVNEFLQTNIPNVYAAGDVTGLSGVWPDAMEQGKTAAMNMCGAVLEYEKPYPFKNTSNFYGITMLSVGKLDDKEEGVKIFIQKGKGSYKKAFIKDGKLQSILIQGDISNTGIYLYLIRKQIPLGDLSEKVFNLSFADFYGYNENTGAYEFAG